MAAISFDKKIVTKSDKAAEILIEGLTEPVANTTSMKYINIDTELERSGSLLKRL